MSKRIRDLKPEVRVELPAKLREFLSKLGDFMKTDQRWALDWLFVRLDAMVESGEIARLGFEFDRAFQLLSVDVPGIDLAKLHRNEKAKSGFVGVYANGKGYRAMGPDGHNLGTFPTSERAAWERYLYCRKHGLIYGPMEEWIARTERDMTSDIRTALEAQGADMPEAYRRFAIFAAAQDGVYFKGLSAEDKVYETTDPMDTYFAVP